MMYKKKTLNIPVELLAEAQRLSGSTTETMAVVLGLEELIKRKKLEALLLLGGKGLVTLSKKEQSRLRSR